MSSIKMALVTKPWTWKQKLLLVSKTFICMKRLWWFLFRWLTICVRIAQNKNKARHVLSNVTLMRTSLAPSAIVVSARQSHSRLVISKNPALTSMVNVQFIVEMLLQTQLILQVPELLSIFRVQLLREKRANQFNCIIYIARCRWRVARIR